MTGLITKWPQFETKVRMRGVDLLKRLDDFPDAILVTGCQRSGTTMLAKILAESEGIHNFRLGAADPCLDAALILSGEVDHEPTGRYCFQTTHVDERYKEYLEHAGDFRVVWCLRNPQSVVYSLMYNWSRWGINTTYRRCGAAELNLDGYRRIAHSVLGYHVVKKVEKACMIYNAKVSQIFEIERRLESKGLIVVDYDDLVRDKLDVLPQIYEFLDLDYRPEYADKILSSSLDKAQLLSAEESRVINDLCGPVYEQAREMTAFATQGRTGPAMQRTVRHAE